MIRTIPLIFCTFLFLNTDAQYCTAVGPTSTIDSNLESFNLSGESSSSISFTGCPGLVYLDDQTALESVILSAGSSYTAFAQFGTCGGNFPGAGQGWIDYNQDGNFEPAESIGTWSGTPPTALSVWNFTVPAMASTGTTRMRVIQQESGTIPLDPCAVYAWGSTVDFTVHITGGMDCSGYLGQSLSEPRPVNSLPYSENHNNSVCYYNVMTVYSSPDVFYRIIPNELLAEYITISLCGSSIDTYLSILNKHGEILFYNDDNTNCGTSSKIHFNASPFDTLYVVVQGYGTETGAYSILVESELANLSDDSSMPDFKVFPNPASNVITLETEYLPAFVEIFDLSGKIMYKIELEKTATNIMLDTFQSGTYLIRLTTEKGTHTQKLFIQ